MSGISVSLSEPGGHRLCAGYYVTPEGDVWSTHRGIRKMKPGSGRGYLQVRMLTSCWFTACGEHLIPNPDGLPQVNHDKSNNGRQCREQSYWTTYTGRLSMPRMRYAIDDAKRLESLGLGHEMIEHALDTKGKCLFSFKVETINDRQRGWHVKRSNRTCGNRPVNMGRSLRARQMSLAYP